MKTEIKGKMDVIRGKSTERINKIKGDAAGKREELAKETEAKINKIKGDAAGKREELAKETEAKINKIKEDAAAKGEEIRGKNAERINKIKGDAAGKREELAKETEAKINKIKGDAAGKREELAKETEAKINKIKKDAAAKGEETGEHVRRGRSQAERMFNDFFNMIRTRQEDLSKSISEFSSSLGKPLADIMETDEAVIIKTDLPGVEKGDIDLNLTEDSVEILAKFKEEYREEDVDYVRRERNYGETRRFIMLPAKVKFKDATAELKNAILTINLPKQEKEKFKVMIK